MDAPLRYTLDEGLATIVMDDGKANVMSLAMLQALGAALDRAQAEAGAVLIVGRPGMFSGGFDLAVFKGEAEAQFLMLEAGAKMAERLLSFPRPVVAACTGHAIAMGAFILLCADVRIGVDQGARIQINEVQIGLTLPHFAIEVARQRLAPAHFNRAAVTAEPYAPQQAVVAGFLDEVVPADTLGAVARERALRLLKLHADAFTATKARLRGPTLAALRAAIEADVAEWAIRFGRP